MMKKIYDVIIIGGQFAGLSFAKEASKIGLDVLLIEKKNDLAKGFGTTGIIVDSWLKLLDIDKKSLYGPVGDIDFYFTKDVLIKIDTDFERFFMSKTSKVLEQLKNDCLKNGVEIKEGHKFERAVKIHKGIAIEVSNKKRLEQYHAKFIIGADGAKSRVAEEFNLGLNTKFLLGLEYIISHRDKVPNNKYSLLFDYKIAPGYCAWLILNKKEYVLGIAGYMGKFSPKINLLKAKKFFEKKENIKLNTENARIKAGIIPVNGVLDKCFNKYAMLIGDAGGYCGPLAAGGIFPAMFSGKFSAKVVADYLKTEKLQAAIVKERIDRINIISNKKELFARRVFDRINDNKELRQLGELIKNKEAENILMKFIYGHPNDISLNKLVIKVFKKWSLYDDMVKLFINLLD